MGKVFLLIACLTCACFAEPPVGNTYLPPSQQYLPAVSTAFRSGGNGYSAPSSLYGVPSGVNSFVRKPYSQYGVPAAVNVYSGNGNGDDSVEVGVRTVGNGFNGNFYSAPSPIYGVPSGVNSFVRKPYSQYGVPAAVNVHSGNGNGDDSVEVGVRTVGNGFNGNVYSAPSSLYGVPLGVNGFARKPYSQYGVPAAVNVHSGNGNGDDSVEVGVRTVGNGFNGNVYSAPSSLYGVPSGVNGFSGKPYSQYGVPAAVNVYSGNGNSDDSVEVSVRTVGNGFGYGNGYRSGYYRSGPNEEESVPANYEFSYEVSAPEYAVEFAHRENRQDKTAVGSYRVLLPDGRTQLVDYKADEEGYKPVITYQESAGARFIGNGGYAIGNGGYSSENGGYTYGRNGGYSR